MMIYKNNSSIAKTFYGVRFEPDEIKEVPGFINDRTFIPVDKLPQKPPVSVESTKSSPIKKEKLHKEEHKDGTNSDQ